MDIKKEFNIEKMKKVFEDENFYIDNMEDIISDEVIDISNNYKRSVNYVMNQFVDKYMVRGEKPIPDNIKFFVNSVLNSNNNRCFFTNINFYLKYMIKLREVINISGINYNAFEFIKNKDNNKDLVSEIEVIATECEQNIDKYPFAVNLVLGRIYDVLGLRTLATEKFSEAIKFNNNYLEFLLYEQPINSYISNIQKGILPNNKIEFINLYNINKKITAIISVNEKYFRAYGTTLLNLFNILEDIHLHINIIGEVEEIKPLINEAIEIYDSICNLRKNNISKPTFSVESIPKNIKDTKTYYACSRYINAKYFMDVFNSDICIVDADITFSNVPYEHFNQCSKYDVSLCMNDNILITPGRKILAGLAYFKNNDNGRVFLDLVKDYMLNNLLGDSKDLWVLDQNALEYAVWYVITNNLEINMANSRKLSPKTPLSQNLFRVVLKKV